MKHLTKAYQLNVVTDLTEKVNKEDFRQLILVANAAALTVEGEGFRREFQTTAGQLQEVDLGGAPQELTITGASVAIFADKGDISDIFGQPNLYDKQNTKPVPTQKNNNFSV